ncbi:anti-sigma factor [Streptomyces sp. NPDC002701]|uniref:anti-sigma factor n=1 Tax=Streptomyces sp. NPDC002701 TaxID=3364661 RepID=UPI00369AF3BF
MKHTDDETLALMAIGDDPSPSSADHVRECAECARQLDALRHVVSTVRTPGLQDHELLTPPPGLWDSITDELGISGQQGSAGTGDDAPGGDPGAVRGRPDRTGQDASAESGPAVGSGPPVTPTDAVPKPRRPSRLAVALAACAALLGAAAGSGITWWVTQDRAGEVASAEGRRLDSLRASSAGYARLSGNDGHRTLDITVRGLPRNSGYFEVWLMDRTHTKLVSVGVLGPDGHADLPVPDTIDLSEYSVVDVSVQPYNGKPDHSGDSVVRGPYAS